MSERPPSRHALSFIFITVLIDMIGFGIIIPVTPGLMMELTGEGLSTAARYAGALLVLYGVMQLFFAPVIGNLSDRFGRRPVLLASLIAFGFDYTLMGFAPTLAWLFVGRALAGIAGATGATANAFIADISAPEDKAKNFGLIGAAFGLGFIIGPVIGGVLGEYGTRVPFFAAAGLAFANASYGWLILPETLAARDRRPFSMARANPIGTLRKLREHPQVIGLLVVMVLFYLAHDAAPSTWSYFTMLKFDWSPSQLGYSLGFLGVVSTIVQAGLIGVVVKRIGESRATYLGLTMMAIGYLGFAFASAGWMMYAFIVPFCLSGLASASLRSTMSNQVPDNAQGELQGAITSALSLSNIIAPLLMTQLFAFFNSEAAPIQFPGAAFFAAALLVAMALLGFARAMSAQPRQAADPVEASVAGTGSAGTAPLAPRG